MDNKKVFANNLQYYLDMSHMTRTDLSDALGISYFTVTSWLNGSKYPRMDKVERLANLFGIQKSDLVEERSVRHKPSFDLQFFAEESPKQKKIKELAALMEQMDDQQLDMFMTLAKQVLK